MALLLGLDISTTGAKAILVDGQGKVVASHSVPQPISQPKPLWSEQNPSDWWAGMAESIRQVVAQVAEEIVGVGLTGQMHGLVCLDGAGAVLRPAILWNDQRTQAQCDEITATVGAERLIQLTGNRALTGFTAPKILWVREHEPEIYAQIRHILLPKDYIRYQLSGEYGTDLAGAAGTLLLDVKNRTWSEDVLAALQIPREWLPPTHEGNQITSYVSAEAAQITGLKAGIPIVGGGGDQAAGAVGMGALEAGIIGLTVGTSGVVFAPLESYTYEPQGRLHAFCHALPNLWHFMGVTLSAAGSLQWYRDTFAPQTSFEDLVNEAAQVTSDGLFFLPYLSGERTPHPDPLARGCLIGLTARHSRAHVTRAVLEGVAFSLKDCLELVTATEAGKQIQRIHVSGGGVKSPVWRQIIADVLGQTLTSVEAVEGAAYGAALLAGLGVGVWSTPKEAAQVIPLGEATRPQADYAPAYATYRSLYPTLKDTFPHLSA